MQVIELGAVSCEVDTVRAEFNSGDLSEVRSEGECEKTSAAGDVYEGAWWWRQCPSRIRGRGMMALGTYKVNVTSTMSLFWKQECVVIDERIVDTVSLCGL